MRRGITILELFCIIVVVASLVIFAFPEFTNFNNYAKAATVKAALNTIRSGIRFKAEQAEVMCGKKNTGPSFYARLLQNIHLNDITADPTFCSREQIPLYKDRKFFEILPNENSVGYSDGIRTTTMELPRNLLVKPRQTKTVVPGFFITNANLQSFGGPCELVDYYNSINWSGAWMFNRDTGEVFAGTNTPGINECSF
jgi:hypothetical protein